MGHSPCEDTVAFQCSGVAALFYFHLWEHYKLSTEGKIDNLEFSRSVARSPETIRIYTY
jgi:hypothetical protein